MVKTKENNTKINKKTATKKTKITKEEKLKQENDLLRKELEEMRNMIMELKTPSITQNQKIEVIEDKIEENEEEYVDIRPDKYIKVISLENNPLILSTEGYGKGKIYRFNNFGEVRNIVYRDLSEIIHNQQSFAESGRFYIMNKNVVKNHGLIEHYNKILTKEMIQNILDFDKDKMVEMFENTTQAQKDAIVSIIIEKIQNKENIDLNKVDALSRIYGKNISEMAYEEVPEEN